MTARMNRRIYGLLGKRLDEIGFDEVRDDRGERGKRWQLGALLRTVTGAMLSGAKSLAEVETLSERMSTPIRKLLDIGRRVPDTTLRDAGRYSFTRRAQARPAFGPCPPAAAP